MRKLIEDQPLRCASMTGLPSDRHVDLIGRVRETAGDEWEKPPVGRPHVLPLPTAVVAVLFGLRHNLPDEVLGEVFGCSQATITRYHEILQPILRWVTRPEVDQRLEQAHREGVLVDGFVAPVGEREHYDGLFSGKKHPSGQNVQVVTNLDGLVADAGEPVNGARHDAAAFFVSGITEGCKQKACNYSVNQLHAAVERAISHLKNWKILETGYHRIMTDFPDILCTATTLEIFRTAHPSFE